MNDQKELTAVVQGSNAESVAPASKFDHKEYSRQWHLANRQRRLAAQKERRAKDPEKYRAMGRRWKANNPEKYKSVSKRCCRNHQKANPEYHRNRNNEYRKKNRKRVNFLARQSYLRRREKIRAYMKVYNATHKVERWLRTQKRRALKRSATVNLASINAWLKKVRAQKFVRCYYCDKKISPKLMHIDHIIALEKGGPHSVENLCTSCATCNLSKNKHLISAWYKAGQQILGL